MLPDCFTMPYHFVALPIPCNAQVPRDLGTFLQQEVGLRDSEIVEIERGEAVAKILDSRFDWRNHVIIPGWSANLPEPSAPQLKN